MDRNFRIIENYQNYRNIEFWKVYSKQQPTLMDDSHGLHEDFMGFTHAKDLKDGQGLAEILLKMVDQIGLEMKN